jgi:hypothetical protein
MKYHIWALCLLLAACGNDSAITVTTQAAEIKVAKPVEPAPLQLLPLNFLVVTSTNQSEQINSLLVDTSSFVALSIKDYENLRINLSDVLRYIQQQQAVIKYYEVMTADKDTRDE